MSDAKTRAAAAIAAAKGDGALACEQLAARVMELEGECGESWHAAREAETALEWVEAQLAQKTGQHVQRRKDIYTRILGADCGEDAEKAHWDADKRLAKLLYAEAEAREARAAALEEAARLVEETSMHRELVPGRKCTCPSCVVLRPACAAIRKLKEVSNG